MARKRPSRAGATLALLLRLLGSTGLFVALLGLIPLAVAFDLTSRDAWEGAVRDYIIELPQPSFTHFYRDVGLSMILVGGAAFLLALLILALASVRTLAGRRNVSATNSALQSALAVALLVGVNVYSFQHYKLFDWTRNRQFTLPPSVAAELATLRRPRDPNDESARTTIVVYQRHKTFGQLSEKPDAFDYAAERKVVEKVQDLVEQFREFGPQFRVELLDIEAEGYEQKLKRLTENAPALRAALDAAPENSIFFYSRRRAGAKPDGSPEYRESVQRLSFNEFYQLDKSASQAADGGRGNLVLLPQGVEPFARKVLAIEERKPRVGIAVIHEWLSTEGPEELTMAGLRKALSTQGFEVIDLVLKKKWGEAGEPEPAAYTLDESKYERLEEEVSEVDASLAAVQSLRRQHQAALNLFRTATLDELARQFRTELRGRPFTEELRKRNIDAISADLATLDFVLQQNTKARKELDIERSGIGAKERVIEERRMTDLKAKLAKLLGECDLLIVPRLTIRDIVTGYRIPPRFYRLDDVQVEAVKEFLKAGKPVLACFGPTNEPATSRMPSPTGPDNLEELLGQLGIRFGKQTVLFGSDSKAFAERRSSVFATAANVEWPLVGFEAASEKGSALYSPSAALAVGEPATVALRSNPIALSMKITGQSVGGSHKLDLRLKHPRPVYFVPVRPGGAKFAPEFLVSDPDSWNEDQPFPARDPSGRERTPRFEPPKPDDPAKGTRDEKRRGPFPLAVAVETTVPVEWVDRRAAAAKAANLILDGADEGTAALALAAEELLPSDVYAPPGYKPTTVRVAAVGHGGLFVGPDLSPAKERLLVNTCNWLLGRDDRLPQAAAEPWRYPRVKLEEPKRTFWFWGTLVALPGLFVYLGRVVLLARRYR